MAVPFGSLIAQRPRVLPTGGAILGRLSEGLRTGFQEGQQRAAEDAAGPLLADYFDLGTGQPQATLGNLATPATTTPRAPAAPVAPFDGRPTRENAARIDAVPATLAGYGNGLTTTGIDPVFGSGLNDAINAYIAAGGNPADVQINSLVRSNAEQADLYRQYQAGQIGLAAPPGQSRHEYGAAADIQDGPFLDWLHQNAGQYGLGFLQGDAYSADPGHVQLQGASPAGTRAPAIPAGGATTSTPTATGGWQPPSEHERAALRALIINPSTRAWAIEEATRRMVPPTQDPFTLGAGDTRYDGAGNVIASRPAAAPQPDYGFTNVPNVGLVQTNGNTGAATTVIPAQPAPPDFQNEEALRDNFRAETSDYRLIQGHYQRLQAAAAEPSAAGDIAMVYAFMKMLDPGSVVRETEYATAQNATGVPDQVRNLWNRVLSGERLGPDQRQDFLNQAANTFAATQTIFDQTVSRYEGLATQYGMDPNRVLGLGAPVPATALAPPAVGAVIDGYRFNGGDPADPNNWTLVQ